MRWLIVTLVVVCMAVVGWLGSALHAVGQLAAAARAGDGSAVLARTDVPAVRRSLTDQVIRAYLDRLGGTRTVKPVERMLASTYGATVADAIIAKLVTAETLTALLKTGRADGADNAPAVAGMPALGDINTDDVLALLGRVGVVQPALLSIRISPGTEADQLASIQMHLDGSGWRLAGISLPKAVVRQLAASLPVK